MLLQSLCLLGFMKSTYLNRYWLNVSPSINPINLSFPSITFSPTHESALNKAWELAIASENLRSAAWWRMVLTCSLPYYKEQRKWLDGGRQCESGCVRWSPESRATLGSGPRKRGQSSCIISFLRDIFLRPHASAGGYDLSLAFLC